MQPLEETYRDHASTSENHSAGPDMRNLLQRRLSVIIPTASRREFGNEFTDDGSEFLPPAFIETAVDEDCVPTSPPSSSPTHAVASRSVSGVLSQSRMEFAHVRRDPRAGAAGCCAPLLTAHEVSRDLDDLDDQSNMAVKILGALVEVVTARPSVVDRSGPESVGRGKHHRSSVETFNIATSRISSAVAPKTGCGCGFDSHGLPASPEPIL